jgi:hypothetical protein
MKPANYDAMSSREKMELGHQLLHSCRGMFVIGKALAVAAEVLRSSNHPWKELSDADDIEVIAYLFEPFHSIEVGSDRVWPAGGMK